MNFHAESARSARERLKYGIRTDFHRTATTPEKNMLKSLFGDLTPLREAVNRSNRKEDREREL